MRTSDVVSHFGTQAAVARALNITRAALQSWGDLVPPYRAMQLEQLTDGKLHYDPIRYRSWNKPRPKSRRRARRAS